MTAPIVYQLDNAGIFVGEVTADPNPREPGAYLIPGRCVTVPPPDRPPGKRARWDGQWLLEDDIANPVPLPPEAARATVEKWKFEKALKASNVEGRAFGQGDTRAFGPMRNAIWTYDADARDEYEARFIITRDVTIQPAVRHGAIVMRLGVIGLNLQTASPEQIATATTEADLFLDRVMIRAIGYPG